ncbi:MAG: flagellar hook-length control protein FliK [Halioglobus sp.]
MDPIQSPIAASALQHKNLEPLLKSWQVGQLLIGRVQDKTASGNLLLQVSGQKMVAASDVAVQKGAVLMLQVTGLSPSPSLKIVHNPVLNTPASTNALEGQLQVLIPRQGSVAAPLLALIDPIQSANILSLAGLKTADLERLFKNIPPLNLLSDPKVLQQAVRDSGFFLEAELARLVLSGGVLTNTDLKASLLRLLFRIEQVLGRSRGIASGAHLPESLVELEEEIKGALATITLNQVAASQRDESDGHTWLFDMPFRYADSVYGLTITILRENPPGGELENHKDWKVLLSMSLPKLGDIEADLFLSGSKVSVVMHAQLQHTADLLKEQLPRLQSGLEGHGLDVSVLLAHRGHRSTEIAKTQWTLSVDIKA